MNDDLIIIMKIFSNITAEVKQKAEGGTRSVQPLGGDGLCVGAATTPDASAPLTSTPNRREDMSTRSVLLPPKNARKQSLRETFVNKPTVDAFSDIRKPVVSLFN